MSAVTSLTAHVLDTMGRAAGSTIDLTHCSRYHPSCTVRFGIYASHCLRDIGSPPSGSNNANRNTEERFLPEATERCRVRPERFVENLGYPSPIGGHVDRRAVETCFNSESYITPIGHARIASSRDDRLQYVARINHDIEDGEAGNALASTSRRHSVWSTQLTLELLTICRS